MTPPGDNSDGDLPAASRRAATLHIKAWHPDKAWAAGGSGFTQHIVSRWLERVAATRGVTLRRLTRRLLRRELVGIPLRAGADPQTFISYLEAFGVEVACDDPTVWSFEKFV